MRKTILLTFGVLAFGGGLVLGQQTPSTLNENGTEWKAQRLEQKVSYIKGFTDGEGVGKSEGMATSIDALRPALASAWTPEVRKTFAANLSRLDQEERKKPNPTIDQLESAMNTFYGDYRNMPVCWSDAITASAASLEGNAPTDAELAITRHADALNGCR